MAERTIVAHTGVMGFPDDLDDGTATALGISGLAAWLPLSWRAELQPGETVLVLGATGVLGTITVQAARLLGAGRVVAAGRDADGLRRATERGADRTVDLSMLTSENSVADRTAAFRDAADGGVGVVVDPLWGDPAVAALRAANPYGRLVQIGSSAASEVTLSPDAFRPSSASILGRDLLHDAGLVEWRAGVLRSEAENVAWTIGGTAVDWTDARFRMIAALRDLVDAEGRQEYRIQIDGVDGIVTPGLDVEGHVQLADLDRAVPVSRYWS